MELDDVDDESHFKIIHTERHQKVNCFFNYSFEIVTGLKV